MLEKPSSEPWSSDLLHREPRDVPVPLALAGSTLKVHVLGLISHHLFLHAFFVISHASV